MKRKFLVLIFLILILKLSVNANFLWTRFIDNTALNINDAVFLGQRGWFCADNGVIKTTNDSGITWTNQNTGINLNIKKIAVNNNASIVSVLCDTQTIIISLDGGVTWINRSPTAHISSNIILKDIAVTSNAIYAVGTNNIILKSTNNGQTWIKQYEGILTSNFIYFFNDNNGLVIGDRHILMTSNAGADWTLTNTPYNFKKVYCYNNYLWFAVTDDNKLYQTIEGPTRWAFLYAFNFNVNSLYFSSYNNGWAVGDNGNIYFTAPNPANWQKLDIPNYPHTFDFNKIFMYENQDTIFIFGDNGYYFMRTFDYTQSDQQLSRFIISDAGGPYFTTIDETVALSAERTIARNKNFLRYRWTKLNNTENAQITDADKMTAVFSADTSGVYFVKLAVDDYRGNYSETFTKICVIDTFINLVSNDTFVTFRNSAALKFNNNNLFDVSLRLRNDFNDLTITINRVDYAETPYILFINRAQSQFLPVIRPNISLYEDLSYTILDFELFDLKTKNNLNRQTFAFDNLRINYALAPNIDNFKNRSFAIFKLDDNYRNWSKIGGDYLYSIDNGIANISTDLQHFSIYALFSIPYFDNDDIFVYPNPFIPNDGNIKTGRHYTGADDGSGIYFSGKKMANAKITIVNLAGFVVFEQRNTNKNYFQWNVSDKKGNRAASGFYYVIIEADDYKCIKKLQIVN